MFGIGIMCIISVVVMGLVVVALLMPIHRIVTYFERTPKRRYIATSNKAG